VPMGAACYPDVALCVPAERYGATYTCVTSHCVTASEDLKNFFCLLYCATSLLQAISTLNLMSYADIS